MNSFADLHTHTNYSDGILSPQELLKKAKKAGINAISVTDHDTIDGCREAISYSGHFRIDVIPGIELTTHLDDKEIHMLAYSFDIQNEKLSSHCEEYKEHRYRRALEMHENLFRAGVRFDFEHILIEAGKGNIGRPHFSNVLQKLGYAKNSAHAFNAYLVEGTPGYVDKHNFPVRDAIKMVHNAGGITSIAHPAEYYSDDEIILMIRLGLDGIEVTHPSNNYNRKRELHYLAKRFGLLETGGSDFHGNRQNDSSNFGKIMIPYSIVESIRYRISARSA